MFIRTVFFLAAACVLVGARPQNNPDPTVNVAVSATDVPAVVNVDLVTGQPIVVVPVKVSASGSASSGSGDVAVQVTPAVVEEGPIVSISVDTTVQTAATEAATDAVTTTVAALTEPTTGLIGFTVPPAPSAGVAAVLGEWQKGATYNVGDQVTFGGDTFKALQQHVASAYNWTPPQAPALWAKV